MTIPSAMIDGIRRKLKSTDDESLWDADLELKPEVEEVTELPTDSAVLLAAERVTGEFSPNTNRTDYYTGLVRAAIEHGGRYGDQQISIPWLRTILAGLEWRNIESETAWDGVDTPSPSVPGVQIPVYNDLFPSDGDVPPGPEPSQG